MLPAFLGDEHRDFMRQGGPPAAVLVHGFPGTPAEMRPLADVLSDAGWTVRAPLLPGFGAQIETLANPARGVRAPGAAEWLATVQAALDSLASAIKQLETEIPPDINWVLRVDGHTDKRPINTPEFPSNWELSAARAITVVKYLVSQGVSEQHLVPAGFGDSRPLDAGDTDGAYAKNRRIEFKLTDG